MKKSKIKRNNSFCSLGKKISRLPNRGCDLNLIFLIGWALWKLEVRTRSLKLFIIAAIVLNIVVALLKRCLYKTRDMLMYKWSSPSIADRVMSL